MIEFANIGATGLYLEIIQQLYDSILQSYRPYLVYEAVTCAGICRSFSELGENYGFSRAFLLIFNFFNAPRVISQIQASLKRSRDSDVMSPKQS